MLSILTRLGGERAARWALVLACMALVVWIRIVPLSLPVVAELSEKIVRQSLRNRLTPIIQKLAPGEDWRPYVDDTADEWVRRNPAQFEADKAAVAARLKSEMTFAGKDGRRYVYLGDVDSYVWLRNARNYLRHGTTCDAVVDGECRDSYGNAPVGYRMIYNRSLHIGAIVALHKAITWLDPAYPLPASSFFVPVIIGVLGVLPAFFIGRHLAGNIGGIFAAILISLQPYFLIRSIGSDNDVWNVVLPLFAAWAVICALRARTILGAALPALLAGLFTAAHAATWRGWVFTYVVILVALAGHLALAAVGHTIRLGVRRVWRVNEMRNVTCALLAYYASTGCFNLLAGVEESAFFLPFRVLADATGLAGQTRPGAIAGQLWPETLRTVAELGKPRWDDVAGLMGGRLLLFGAWLGLALLVLPNGRWKLRHFGLVVWTTGLYVACYHPLISTRWSWNVLIFLLAAPLLLELLIRALEQNPAEDQRRGWALILLVWFVASLAMTQRGIRFVLLFAAPFGLSFAIAADILRQCFGEQIRLALRGYGGAATATVLSYGILPALLLYPVLDSYRTMKAVYPMMNSAWWDSLIKIRNESSPEAIVNTWWDYGYWVKYVAERRASSDGGSLRTHVPHWLAKALLAPSDEETVAILRMLNCGSDATPLPEGSQGAYGKLTAMGFDAAAAYSIIDHVVRIGRADAERYLVAQGLTTEQQTKVLDSTHCPPPESFLVISKDMLGQWMRLGAWDVRRAFMAYRTRFLPERQALEELANRFGYTPEAAARMYQRLSGTKSEAEIKEFIAPPLGMIPGGWEECRSAGGPSKMTCRIAVEYAGGQMKIIDFLYDNAAPKDGSLRHDGREGRPAVIVVLGARGLEESAASAAEFSDIGVLLDPAGRRVLVGMPLLIRSTLVRLIYLGERHAGRFRSFDRRGTLLGDEVVTWKIDWGGE